ncbi:MAG: hypothetical protein K940chlam8_00034 [Chlamydiae bacterium]|nr:hypothetical protein [Chlamydiota bacterium]
MITQSVDMGVFQVPYFEQEVNTSHPHLTWIGHSTFMMEIEGMVFLTDPIWSKRCTPFYFPFRFLGVKRQEKIPMGLKDLKKVDVVLISHNHYDHLDKYTIKKLHQKFPNITWFVPKGLKKWFDKRKIENVIELDWWERSNQKDYWIEAVPVKHMAYRLLFDYNKSKCAGFVLNVKGKSVYFVGDTAYRESIFRAVSEKFKSFTLSLIPIGAYYPRMLFKNMHICPIQAVKIHQIIKSKMSIACHWNTFRLTFEKKLTPVKELVQALKDKKITLDEFCVVKIGQTINW